MRKNDITATIIGKNSIKRQDALGGFFKKSTTDRLNFLDNVIACKAENIPKKQMITILRV